MTGAYFILKREQMVWLGVGSENLCVTCTYPSFENNWFMGRKRFLFEDVDIY